MILMCSVLELLNRDGEDCRVTYGPRIRDGQVVKQVYYTSKCRVLQDRVVCVVQCAICCMTGCHDNVYCFSASQLLSTGANVLKRRPAIPLQTIRMLRSLNICATTRTHRGTSAGLNHIHSIPVVLNMTNLRESYSPGIILFANWKMIILCSKKELMI